MAPLVAPLWYNGDRDATTQALPNGLNYAGFPDARVYSDFNVTSPNGWIISSLFSNNLFTNSASPVTQAAWEIRTGVGVGTGGTLLYSGTSAATKVATGRSISGFNEYTIKVSGLNIVLPAGTYFLNVAPIGPGVDNSYLSATNGLNAIGLPAGNNGNEIWRQPATTYGGTSPIGNDFSQGVIGNVVVPCVTPSTTYVDDDWSTAVIGDDPDGAGPATYFGCDAFATIQGGVNGVATNGNVIVASGTYNEAQVLITRAMTVTGAGSATTTLNGGNLAIPNAGLVRIVTPVGDAGTATFQGFTITNPGLSPETAGTHVAVYARPLNAAARTRVTNNHILGVNSSDNGFYSILNVGTVEFDHNNVTNIGFNPIVIERSTGPTDVHDNTFSGYAFTAYFNFTYFATDVLFQQRVADNTFSGGSVAGAIVFNSSYPAVAPFTGRFSNVSVTGNSIPGLGANRVGITLVNQASLVNAAAGAIENPVISGNTITGTGASNSKGIRISGLVTDPSINGNNIRSLNRGISGEVTNSHSATGAAIHLNNLVGNTTGLYWDAAASADAENNWWGCNAGPGGMGCDQIGGTNSMGADADPRMVLGVSASPSSVPISGSTTITADMTKNSAAASPMGFIPNIPVSFSATLGMMAPGAGTITSGLASSMFTSNSVFSGSGCAMVDNQQVCTPVTVDLGTTSGQVTLLNGSVGVPGVTVSATDGMAVVSDVTDSNGDYSLFGFTPGMWTVTPSKPPYNVYSYNGIFSNDATLVSRHVVGLITLDSNQLKAAKVAGLPNLSSFDAALIAQHIIGISNPINKSGTWAFTPSSTMPNVLIDNTQDYGATLFGDVNGSWDPMGPRPAPVLTDPERIKNAVHVSLPRVKAAPGSEIVVPLRIENLKGRSVDSFQFDVEYDADMIAPAEAAAGIEGTLAGNMTIAFNSPVKGLLKVVVYGAFPATGDGVYVNLRFHVNGVDGMTSPLTIRNFRLNDGIDDIFTGESRIVIRSGSDVVAKR